jgi:hypothetical protein
MRLGPAVLRRAWLCGSGAAWTMCCPPSRTAEVPGEATSDQRGDGVGSPVWVGLPRLEPRTASEHGPHRRPRPPSLARW